MNAQPNPMRRRIAALMLAAVLASTSGVFAHADTPDTGPGNPGAGFTIDGLWAAATCGFAMVLARVDPGFYGSAVMICVYALALDP